MLKTTLLDFPGEVAAAVFTPGCNLRCPYCHNPELVRPPFPDEMISLEKLGVFLEKRASLLGGVCITGGEPLLHDNIGDLVSLIRSHGLKVKLDTNGTFPERLARIDADYIAMDLKTDPEKYHRLLPPGREYKGEPGAGVTGGGYADPGVAGPGHSDASATGAVYAGTRVAGPGHSNASATGAVYAGTRVAGPGHSDASATGAVYTGEAVRRSIRWLRDSGIPYELRTTAAPGIVDENDMRAMLPLIQGAKRYVLTPFRPGHTLDPRYSSLPALSGEYMHRLFEIAETSGVPCVLRQTAQTAR